MAKQVIDWVAVRGKPWAVEAKLPNGHFIVQRLKQPDRDGNRWVVRRDREQVGTAVKRSDAIAQAEEFINQASRKSGRNERAKKPVVINNRSDSERPQQLRLWNIILAMQAFSGQPLEILDAAAELSNQDFAAMENALQRLARRIGRAGFTEVAGKINLRIGYLDSEV